MNVRVITHTGSDITPEEASALGVELIYDHILFKGKEYPALADTVDLGMMLSSASDQPTTSHPSIGDFFEAFEKSEKDCESVFLSVTSDMSGTYATGCAAVGLMERTETVFPLGYMTLGFVPTERVCWFMRLLASPQRG